MTVEPLHSINVQQSIKIIQAMATAIVEQQSHLSALDSKVGDGDHGVNIAKAMQKAANNVVTLADPTLDVIWRTAGKTVQNSVGGASGLLFGAFFIGASRTLKDKEAAARADIVEMLAAGLAAVQKRGKAQPGDKTMVDALAPAVNTAQAVADTDIPLSEALHQIAEAAKAGAESTQTMIARHGRAKFLGERSLGHQDAGATSMAIMLNAWAEAVEGW